MDKEQKIRFFLGANSAHGFHSLYDSLADPYKGDYIWYIKGGPGSGKSTFMRRAAEAAEKLGYHVAYVLCSGDPSSLDGIYIYELKTAYVDATSPHIQEPRLPGAAGRYIDFSDFYKKDVSIDSERIADLFKKYRQQYARAYELLNAAALCSPSGIPGAVTEEAKARIRCMARETAKELPESGVEGGQKGIFLSALTGKGRIRCIETVGYTEKTLKIRSAFGLEDVFLQALSDECRSRKLYCILCRDPLLPERLEGLIVPEASFSVLSWHRKEKDTVNLDDALDPDILKSVEEDRKRCSAEVNRLLKLASFSLDKASVLHSELEEVYRPTVDFPAVSAYTERHIIEHIK